MTTIIRTNKIKVGTDSNNCYDWIDNFTIKYASANVWADIPIPYGEMKHQAIRSPHVQGTLHCRNFDTMSVALYETIVNSNDEYLLEEVSNIGTIPHVAEYFVCELVSTDNTIKTATINNFAIETFGPEEVAFGKDTIWRIDFHGDSVVYT